MPSHPQDNPAPQNVALVQGGADNPVVAAPNLKIQLVELLESREGDIDWGVVKDPGPDAKLGAGITWVTRDAKDGNNYKQYINLPKGAVDPANAGNSHPDYDQYITLRARVRWEDANRHAESLAGRKVRFTYTRKKDGKGRPDSLESEGLNSQKDGFGHLIDVAKTPFTVVDTGQGGWTPEVRFYLSKYGGDQFEIHAQAIVVSDQGPSGKKLTIGTYEVWRKFWYQVTRSINLTLPSLEKARSAWARVKVDIEEGTPMLYDSTTDGVPAGTFYPHWQLKGGQSIEERVVIGSTNRQAFYDQFQPEDDKPVQIHLIVCHYQGDSRLCPLVTTGWTRRNTFDHKVDTGGNGAVVGPRQGGGDFVGTAAYQIRTKGADNRWTEDARIPLDSNRLSVVIGRSSTSKVHVDLTHLVLMAHQQWRVQFSVFALEMWAGESDGHHVICGTRTPWGLKDTDFFNSIFVHEVGHSFGQVPEHGHQSPSLGNHPNLYDLDNGGHCRHGLVSRCVMHAGGIRMPTTFCSVCNKYVRLEDMSRTVDPK